eukprot:337114-Ditylum_brightwellii.AAC.1
MEVLEPLELLPQRKISSSHGQACCSKEIIRNECVEQLANKSNLSQLKKEFGKAEDVYLAHNRQEKANIGQILPRALICL